MTLAQKHTVRDESDRLPTARAPAAPIVVDGVTFRVRGSLVWVPNTTVEAADEAIEAIGLQPTEESPFDPVEHWTLVRYKRDGAWEQVRVYCASDDYNHRLDGTRVPIEVIQ